MLKAAYRFFDNDAIDAQDLLQSHVESTYRRLIGRYLSRLSKLNHVVSLTLNHVLITKDRFELQL
jgi:hypothetical protein